GRDVRPVAALLLVGVDEDVLALLDLDDVVVARDAPQLVGRVPVGRGVLAQPGVGPVGVVDVEGTVQDVEGARLGHGRRLGRTGPGSARRGAVRTVPDGSVGRPLYAPA